MAVVDRKPLLAGVVMHRFDCVYQAGKFILNNLEYNLLNYRNPFMIMLSGS